MMLCRTSILFTTEIVLSGLIWSEYVGGAFGFLALENAKRISHSRPPPGAPVVEDLLTVVQVPLSIGLDHVLSQRERVVPYQEVGDVSMFLGSGAGSGRPSVPSLREGSRLVSLNIPQSDSDIGELTLALLISSARRASITVSPLLLRSTSLALKSATRSTQSLWGGNRSIFSAELK